MALNKRIRRLAADARHAAVRSARGSAARGFAQESSLRARRCRRLDVIVRSRAYDGLQTRAGIFAKREDAGLTLVAAMFRADRRRGERCRDDAALAYSLIE
ncbi:hypothetical protein [Xanthomonas bonasiae]|uniref:hypothetical protein n=1 Tax=Xanthomonas bonasiae TaxID=2810351 RepID=UPI00197E2ADF|nr:hypothetical protein [Xanthomonas bonasiae]MBN6110163.1 hypothetical protein [Xanthomonas bonasiae]